MLKSVSSKFYFIFLISVVFHPAMSLGDMGPYPIIRASGNQQNPAIHNNIVVCEDYSSGESNISIADISNLSNIQHQAIDDSFSEARNPAVYGDIVVWEEKFFLYEDYDIIGYNLRTDTSFPIFMSFADERYPSIYGNIVVAQVKLEGYSDYDIFGADISRPDNQNIFGVDASSMEQQRPDVFGNIVVYQDNYLGDWDISGVDISNPDEPDWFSVFSRFEQQQMPAVSGNWVVCEDNISGAWDISGDNIFHPLSGEVLAADENSDSQNADICNNIVVWQDKRNGNWDIYGLNLTTKDSFQITSNSANQTCPAISFNTAVGGYMVVWQDYRNENWDIYGKVLDGPNVAGSASPLKWDINADGIVDEVDVDEVQAHEGQQNGVPY